MLTIKEWKENIKEKTLKKFEDNFISEEKVNKFILIKLGIFGISSLLSYISLITFLSSGIKLLFFTSVLFVFLSARSIIMSFLAILFKKDRKDLINNIKKCIEKEDRKFLDIIKEVEAEFPGKVFKDKKNVNKISEEDIRNLISILNKEEKKEMKIFFKDVDKKVNDYDSIINFINTLETENKIKEFVSDDSLEEEMEVNDQYNLKNLL
jgi:hypothetical protein